MALTEMLWRLTAEFSARSKYGLNGSLWTLPVEVRLYAAILAFHLLGILRGPFGVVFATLLILSFLNSKGSAIGLDPDWIKLTYFFLAGTIASTFKKFIPVSWLIAVGWLVLTIAIWRTQFRAPIAYGAMIYTLLFLFTRPWIVKIELPGDFSYGVYIYGFVIQQTMAHLFLLSVPFPTPWRQCRLHSFVECCLGTL